jgi:uncharacterized membrane protein YcaP (DUF421 family)
VVIAALGITVQEAMLDKHVELVHIQLRRTPATRVPVVAAALATIVQEEVLDKHVELVHILQR